MTLARRSQDPPLTRPATAPPSLPGGSLLVSALVQFSMSADKLGFGKPQICVEVKSGSDSVDRPTVDKLIGAGQKFGAETCLFVSWGGFRPNVQKELARDFFRVRLWSRKELIEKLFARYDQLPEEIRLAFPLRRVWMVANQEKIL